MSYLSFREPAALAYFGEHQFFDPPCPNCLPGTTEAQCEALVRRAIRAAIQLANNAAEKLEASPRDAETVRLFRFFFGHDPSLQISYADNQESGANVAHRFRKVAEALKTRGIRYRCTCPGAPATRRGQAAPGGIHIDLCNAFWNIPAGLHVDADTFRAGVLIHETLHMLYGEFLVHATRRANAHCYEAFAMRLAGHAADPSDVTRCRHPPP